MSRRLTCATGVDLEQAQAEGRVSVADADAVRAFQRFLQQAPPPPPPGRGYTREQLGQYRAALVEYDEAGHADVIARIDTLLAAPVLSDPPATVTSETPPTSKGHP